MNSAIRTPVIDRNGKPTHVWKNPDQTTTGSSRTLPPVVPATNRSHVSKLVDLSRFTEPAKPWEEMLPSWRQDYIAGILEDLMEEHELTGDNFYDDELWSYEFTNNVKTVGKCHFAKRLIQVSNIVIEKGDRDEAIAVAVHEIAHAVAGPRAGHSKVWKAYAVSLGLKNPKHSIDVAGLREMASERIEERKLSKDVNPTNNGVEGGDMLLYGGTKLQVEYFNRVNLVAREVGGEGRRYNVPHTMAARLKQRYEEHFGESTEVVER